MMWSMVLDQEGCSIKKVVIKVMETAPPLKEEHLSDIMLYVGTSSHKRDQILKKIANGQIQIFDALEDILQEWLVRKSREANLGQFLEYLKKCQLNSYADAIEKEFKQQTLVNIECGQNLGNCDDTNHANDYTPLTSSIQTLPMNIVDSENQLSSESQSREDVSEKSKSIVVKVIVMSFVVLCIFGMVVFVDLQESTFKRIKIVDGDDSKRNLQTHMGTSTLEPNRGTSLERCAKNRTVTKILVHSYRDFERIFPKLDKHCHQFSLAIESEAVKGWPKKSTLLADMYINEVSIKGEMTVDKIIGILQQTKNLEMLHLDNKLGELCHINQNATSLFEEIPQCGTSLPKLAYLNMSNFDSCDTLMTMLLACIKMQPIKIEFTGNINDENVQQISELFKNSLVTLKELKIASNFDTRVNVIPTGHSQNHVQHISVDILNMNVGNAYGKVLIDNSFCGSFPLLQKLKVKGGYFNINDLKFLESCNAIQDFSIGINVNETDLPIISHSFFRDNFPALASVDVYLVFISCPSPDVLTDFVNELGNLKSLMICSNCIVSNNRSSKCYRKMAS